ncbi:YopX family protein [Bacillus velezensis]
MREIKFRSWIKNKNEMIYEFTLKQPTASHCQKNILMQYTGLKDKYGREIYEGDIILEHNTDTKFVVKYDNRHASYYLDLDIGDSDGAFMVGDLEIIGNIYVNPGLLKTK